MSKAAKIYWGTGRRKTATARVKMTVESGDSIVNEQPLKGSFVLEPLKLVGLLDKVSISAKVHGGGIMSQVEATRLGIAKALVNFDSTFRPTLRKAGLLTRDPREKERKKYGKKKARRSPQWSKR